MTPAGLARLKADEGLRLSAYADPLSPLACAMCKPANQRPTGWAKLSGDPWTVGYGATGESITATTCWSKAKADADIEERVAKLEKQLAADLPWFKALDPVRRDVLVNLAYNVGRLAMESWKTTLANVAAHRFDAAADNLLHEGAWNRQVGARADRLAAAMRSGAWSA